MKITLVSVTADGKASGNGRSTWPEFSPNVDRPLIAFVSEASNLTSLDTDNVPNVFVAEWKDPDA